jgi:CubicO group peptidase (beta-lactamase class C family)
VLTRVILSRAGHRSTRTLASAQTVAAAARLETPPRLPPAAYPSVALRVPGRREPACGVDTQAWEQKSMNPILRRLADRAAWRPTLSIAVAVAGPAVALLLAQASPGVSSADSGQAGAAHLAAVPRPPLPVAAPESVGVSAERLRRIGSTVGHFVSDRQLAGAVVVVARAGRVVLFEASGHQDVERNVPLRLDTIFRLASMSKAVTSVAAVILMEEGRLRLSDPVSRFLPAYRHTTVAVPGPAGAGGRIGTIPARREMTVRDLLTHTAGISYGQGLAADQYKTAGLQGWYLADRTEPIVPLMERLASLPFDAQPGERFVYGYGTDILGAVIERASGMPLDEFLRLRIFEPLRMVDSGFFVPAEQRARLAVVYSLKAGGTITRAPDGGTGQGHFVDGPRRCFGGGAGLVSTASDYTRFLQMLLNGGELDGVRILSPASVALMTSNHVGTLYQEGALGFGLGFEIVEHVGRSGRPGSAGAYGWGSAYDSIYWVDPAEQLVAIYLTQLIPNGGLDLRDRFRYLVYQAIVGPVPSPPPPRR